MRLEDIGNAEELARELKYIDQALSRLSKYPKQAEVKIGVPAVPGVMGHEHYFSVQMTPSAGDVINFLYNRRTEIVVDLKRMGVEVDE